MFELRCGGYQPPRSIHNVALRELGLALGERFGDACAFSLTGNITADGHKASDLLDMVEGDELDLCYFSSSYLAARVADLAVFDQPFPSMDRAQLFRRLDGEAGERLKRAVAAATGFEVVAFWDNGLRHISNRLRPIVRPADCAGLSIRVLPSSLYAATFKALGAAPEVIDVKDLRQAVLEGRVDAQENPLTNIVTFGLDEAHRHVSLTGHFQGIALVLANKARFNRLSAEMRGGIGECLTRATALQRTLAVKEDTDCLDLLEGRGVAVVRREALDLAGFRAAVAGVAATSGSGIDPALLKQLRAD
jgi:C4-dicarboxylate-binding protein DctP